jgi:AraC-like DNA-binding protein
MLGNCLDRLRISPTIFGWSYTFARPSPTIPWLALGVEIGVVLAGERRIARPGGADERLVRGTISIANIGERYVTQFEPRGDAGREIGFVIRLDRDEAWKARDAIVVFEPRIVVDARLLELAEAVARSFDRQEPMPADASGEVKAFVERHGEIVPADALLRAQLELHRHFDKPLYMRHFAEIAGVHEATFGRKFAARFGVTPTRYRTMLRLHEAAVLLATKHDITVTEAARRVGFEDVPYFHRAFAARLGVPPLKLARRFSSDPPPAPALRHSVVVPAAGAVPEAPESSSKAG